MEHVTLTLTAQSYNALVSALALLPNHTNTYGILQEIERQAKEQMDAFEVNEKSKASATDA
jgi:hypothetical protein